MEYGVVCVAFTWNTPSPLAVFCCEYQVNGLLFLFDGLYCLLMKMMSGTIHVFFKRFSFVDANCNDSKNRRQSFSECMFILIGCYFSGFIVVPDDIKKEQTKTIVVFYFCFWIFNFRFSITLKI